MNSTNVSIAPGYFSKHGAASATPSLGGVDALCDGTDANWDYCDFGPCPRGHECTGGTGEPRTCVPGKYAPVKYTNSCWTCRKGFWCDGVSSDVLLQCPEGHYCPNGTGVDQPSCPKGSFGHRTNLTSAGQCRKCQGRYCSKPGLASPDGFCEAGYYCPAGSYSGRGKVYDEDVEHVCPAGAWCAANSSTPTNCTAGKFSPSAGARKEATCQACTAGSFCATDGLAEPTGPCAEGFYCRPSSTSATPATGVCPAGSACPEGSPSPVNCIPGTYANRTKMGACEICLAGSYCLLNSSLPLRCPRGFFCPEGTRAATERPCPPGTWINVTGSKSVDACLPAPNGTYALGYGNEVIDGNCSAGSGPASGLVWLEAGRGDAAASPRPRRRRGRGHANAATTTWIVRG